MNTSIQRRIASKILKCGENRIWIDPQKLKDVAEAITREDVRRLIKSGAMVKSAEEAPSRAGIRLRAIKKIKGRRSGQGSRKGTFSSRTGNTKKLRWIRTIRPQRQMISELKSTGAIDNEIYKTLYKLSKGGVFRSRKHLELYMKEHKMLAEKDKKEEKGVKK
ncbi:MAG: 50S ribosomal protein L19e [Candidatus Aenigmarchaeota archaeon]|nr:50S ribosomal protein L19e [Candidatus Aenigmarchaeota archaeon]